MENNWLFQLCHLEATDYGSVTLSRGDTIEGEEKVCFVFEGTLQVLTVSKDGQEVLVNTLKSGDIFGVYDLFLQEAHHSTILRAKTKTTLALVDKELVRSRLLSSMDAMVEYVRFCNDRLQFLLGRIKTLTPSSARQRLAGYLLSHADRDGKVMLPTKEALAKELGIGRSSLFRELAYLSQKGVTRSDGTKNNIVNIEALQAEISDEEEITQ